MKWFTYFSFCLKSEMQCGGWLVIEAVEVLERFDGDGVAPDF